ncbi:hypothetical protein [Nonomuraea polychroma]|nr:hypothetical protein [Nonomuraea polychroma]
MPVLAVVEVAGRPPPLLHLHGGAYVAGSAFEFRPLAGALAVCR